ncbi:MAG: anti-sigma factor [Verrucomicrobia bacterium]|nr:anti-sigma factor [Verrucomicrobiota bacterium]
MISHELQEQAALYALGALDAHGAAEFERTLQANRDLQQLVRELRDSVGAMAYAAAPAVPSSELRERVLEKVAAEARRRQLPREHKQALTWLPWAIAACLVAACCALLVNRAQLKQTAVALGRRAAAASAERDQAEKAAAENRQRAEAAQSQIVQLRAERDALTAKISQVEEQNNSARIEAAKLTADRNALQDRLAALERNASVVVATLNSKLREAPEAFATLVWDGEKQQGVLRTNDVPATAGNQDYQLWIADPRYKDPVNGGVFSVGKNGKAEYVFKPKQRITSATAFLVSLERKGGVTKAEGPIVLASK